MDHDVSPLCYCCPGNFFFFYSPFVQGFLKKSQIEYKLLDKGNHFFHFLWLPHSDNVLLALSKCVLCKHCLQCIRLQRLFLSHLATLSSRAVTSCIVLILINSSSLMNGCVVNIKNALEVQLMVHFCSYSLSLLN